MPRIPDEKTREAFREFHNVDRPIYHIAHARKANDAEDYSSEKVREASARTAGKHMEVAKGVFEIFSKRSSKKRA